MWRHHQTMNELFSEILLIEYVMLWTTVIHYITFYQIKKVIKENILFYLYSYLTHMENNQLLLFNFFATVAHESCYFFLTLIISLSLLMFCMLHIYTIWHHFQHPHVAVRNSTLQSFTLKSIPSSLLLSSFRLPLHNRCSIITVIECQRKRVNVIRFPYFFEKRKRNLNY